MTLQAFALAASNGRTTPRKLSFTALLNSLSLHLVTMRQPDLWPPFYVAVFFKQAVKIELSDFYLPPNHENWGERLKLKLLHFRIICPSSTIDVSDTPLSAQPTTQLFLHIVTFFTLPFYPFFLSNPLRKHHVGTDKMMKMHYYSSK